jgi:hypothetical protein
MNLDSPLPSNVITFQIPVGLSITAATDNFYIGYVSTSSPVFNPGGALHPSTGAIATYPIYLFFVVDTSGIAFFLLGLLGAPTNTAWSISFTDSNNVVWNFNSTQATPTVSNGITEWHINLNGPTYPYLVVGVTYPITVH